MNRRTTDSFRGRWGPVIAYLAVAGVLAYGLYLQRSDLNVTKELAARSACETLEHRIGSRASARDVLKATKAGGTMLADLAERSLKSGLKVARREGNRPEARRDERLLAVLDRLRDRVDSTSIPPPPEPKLTDQRDRLCRGHGIVPEDHSRTEGGTP